ncbi:hypothetical protein GGU10DRAFT_337989, partial [Lentinula aff. detonsa]
MSTTSSPARPVRSPTPVLNKEDVELQAFLAAAQREAQEKWEKLRAAKTSGVVGKVVEGEAGVVGLKENVVEGVAEEEEEVVLKIILIPKKRRNVVETEVVESSRKRRKVVQSPVIVDTDSDSIPVPFPRPCERCIRGDQVCRPQANAPNAVACERCHLARQSCSFLQKSKKLRVRSPPNESDREEQRELRFTIEELTVQVRA